MSAIFGMLHLDGSSVNPELLARMESALATEGPDGGGRWSGGSVALGHRLMCFTPEDEAEQQPLVSGNADLVLVFDGRLDDRWALARELGMSRRRAETSPDSALLLRAYARMGRRCVQRLVGDFAFALWDGRRQMLLAARSAPGGRPFFYYDGDGLFAFASRPRGLFALPELPRRVDEEHLAGFLASVDTGLGTFYRDIHRLQPGQLLTVGSNGHRTERWWRPDLLEKTRFTCDRDYREAFDELLQTAVGDHLRAAGRVGIMVSGGLDSSSVAASAAHQLQRGRRSLRAYTEVPPPDFDGELPPGRYSDESKYVRALARMYPSVELHQLESGHAGLLTGVERCFAWAEVPHAVPTNRGWIESIYAKAREDRVRVMLNGDLGNFAASRDGGGLLTQLLGELRFSQAVREARGLVSRGEARSTWRVLAGQGLMPLLPSGMRMTVEGLRPRRDNAPWRAYSLISPDFAAEHHLCERARRSGPFSHYQRPGDYRTTCWEVVTRATNQLAEMGAAHRSVFGVDTRAPLGDRRLVEFCLTLPEEQWARDGETRVLVRSAMAHRLPPEILGNRQRGLQSAAWHLRMKGERERLLAEVAQFEQSEMTRRVFDLPRLRHLLEHWPADVATNPAMARLYRFGVATALVTGRFLLWVDSTREDDAIGGLSAIPTRPAA